MQIQEAVLHQIAKDAGKTGANAVKTKMRDERHAINQQLQDLAEAILKTYATATSGYGTFDGDEDVYRFPLRLREYVAGDDFIAFSQAATRLIAAKAADKAGATGGHALFLRYVNQGQDWFLVAMLKLKAGTGVNQETMELAETLSFDIDHLHEAARVDLVKWQADVQPYLSFIKKRQGKDDVSQYFREALGCTEYSDSKHNTTQLLKALDEFCDSQGWEQAERQDARRRVYEYLEARRLAKEPANLTALSAHVLDQDPGAFAEHVRGGDYQVNETFKPHKGTFVRLFRINGKIGNVKVSFDVADLREGRVAYDPNGGSLIIYELPDQLIDEIKKNLPEHDAADG